MGMKVGQFRGDAGLVGHGDGGLGPRFRRDDGLVRGEMTEWFRGDYGVVRGG